MNAHTPVTPADPALTNELLILITNSPSRLALYRGMARATLDEVDDRSRVQNVLELADALKERFDDFLDEEPAEDEHTEATVLTNALARGAMRHVDWQWLADALITSVEDE